MRQGGFTPLHSGFHSMKKKKIPIFLFIDAFGWEILKAHPSFLEDRIIDKRKLRTILGYSSACDPSIISGLKPDQHKQWSSFFYSQSTCPYRWVKWLRLLPAFVTDYHRVRFYVSKVIKKIHRFTGYFQIYNVPFQYLPLFDYAEKHWIWGPEGLLNARTIFNILIDNKLPYYVHELDKSDEYSLKKLKKMIANQSVDFTYIGLGKLDAFMHAKGTHDPGVSEQVQWYDGQIRDLLAIAEANYDDVPFYVFTDHGMHNIKETFDLQRKIESLSLDFGNDYVAIYDSTMARFWFLKELARNEIKACLEKQTMGRILPEAELKDLGVFFPDSMYGEIIFLMNSNVQIVPSFMGKKFTPGIHGFHPDDADSYACICSNRALPKKLIGIEQIFWIMLHEMGLPDPQEHPETSIYN